MKVLTKFFLFLAFLFISPTFTHAADLNITCYQEQKPVINSSTTPLFQLSNFLPGDTVTKSVEIINNDSVNPCVISIQGDGNSNILTDSIRFSIDSLYSKSLSDFIGGDNIQIANLQPNQSVNHSMTLYFPSTATNLVANKSANFDIKINSQWGNEQGDVLGDNTNTVNTNSGNNKEILGEIENEKQRDTLGTTKGTQDICDDRTLWWIPLVIQILLTLLILPSKKVYSGNIFIKLFLTLCLGILAFFITKEIGCGCDTPVLCKYSWILNILFGVSPMPLMIKKFLKR